MPKIPVKDAGKSGGLATKAKIASGELPSDHYSRIAKAKWRKYRRDKKKAGK